MASTVGLGLRTEGLILEVRLEPAGCRSECARVPYTTTATTTANYNHNYYSLLLLLLLPLPLPLPCYYLLHVLPQALLRR